MFTINWFRQWCQGNSLGEGQSVQQMVLEQLDMKKRVNLDPYLIPHKKINSKQIALHHMQGIVLFCMI